MVVSLLTVRGIGCYSFELQATTGDEAKLGPKLVNIALKWLNRCLPLHRIGERPIHSPDPGCSHFITMSAVRKTEATLARVAAAFPDVA